MVNYLIYHEKILNMHLQFSDHDGPVITLGLTKRKDINLDSQNNILNKGGKIASIVHQYDRHRDLKKLMKVKFCPEYIYGRNIQNNIIIFFVYLEVLIVFIFIKQTFIFNKFCDYLYLIINF